MGCWYGVHGSVRVKDTEKTRELVEALEGDCGEIEVCTGDHGDQTFTLTVDGGQSCGYGTAERIDDHLRAFGPYVVGPAVCFYTNCDDLCRWGGENGEVWVGNAKAVKEGQRKAFVDEAREAIRKLTVLEWEALHAETMDAGFWIGSDSPEDE